MSIRAYRVIEIKTEVKDSFNLWHDKKLMDFLNQEGDFFGPLSSDATGLTSISIEVLQGAIDNAIDLELDENIIKALKADIEFAKSRGDDWVEYYCY